MRTRAEVLQERKNQAAAIAAGSTPPPTVPSTEVEKPAVPEPSVLGDAPVEAPKRRSRSSVTQPVRTLTSDLERSVESTTPKTDEPKPPAGETKVPETGTTGLDAEADRRAYDAAVRDANQRREVGDKTAADLSLGDGYDRIVTHLFRLVDPMKVYEEVRQTLRMGGRASASSYGELVDALDDAAEASMRAIELLVNAKDAHDAFEIDAKIIMATMRQEATDILEDQKAKGLMKKAITNDDVEAVMAANHPDDWQELERKRGRAKRTIDMLAALHEAAREREKDLRAMVSKFRGDS